MIRPVSALTPKVMYRGESTSEKQDVGKYRRRFAVAGAVGTSLALGAVTTVIARNYTSNWAHSGIYGALGTAAALMFLVPGFKYKADSETKAIMKNTENSAGKKVLTDSIPKRNLRKKLIRLCV